MNPRLPRSADHSKRRRTAQIASAAGLIAALSLSGCQWTSKIITQKQYDAADGISVQVGDVQLRNVLIVAGQQGGPGTLVAWGHNPSPQPVTVAFSTGAGGQISLPIPAGGEAQLSGAGTRSASLRSVPVGPGKLADLNVSTPAGGSVTARVPVVYPFDGSPYRTLAPTGFTPRPAETTAGPEDAHGPAQPSQSAGGHAAPGSTPANSASAPPAAH